MKIFAPLAAVALSIVLLSETALAAERSCCSSHGGIASCNLSAERLTCSDGFLESGCMCNAKTRINQQSFRLTKSKIAPTPAPKPAKTAAHKKTAKKHLVKHTSSVKIATRKPAHASINK